MFRLPRRDQGSGSTVDDLNRGFSNRQTGQVRGAYPFHISRPFQPNSCRLRGAKPTQSKRIGLGSHIQTTGLHLKRVPPISLSHDQRGLSNHRLTASCHTTSRSCCRAFPKVSQEAWPGTPREVDVSCHTSPPPGRKRASRVAGRPSSKRCHVRCADHTWAICFFCASAFHCHPGWRT